MLPTNLTTIKPKKMSGKVGIKLIIVVFLLSIQGIGCSQYIHSGKITFERRTNLEKRYNDPRMRRMINENNKIVKIQKYLYCQYPFLSLVQVWIELPYID